LECPGPRRHEAQHGGFPARGYVERVGRLEFILGARQAAVPCDAGFKFRVSGHEQDRRRPILKVVFFRTEVGNEPVREWLRGLVRQDRKTVCEDIKTAQFGWPIGMPLIRKLATGLWEVRSHISTGIARVIFTVDGQTMVLLHGFQKKSRRTPPADLLTTKRRLARLQAE